MSRQWRHQSGLKGEIPITAPGVEGIPAVFSGFVCSLAIIVRPPSHRLTLVATDRDIEVEVLKDLTKNKSDGVFLPSITHQLSSNGTCVPF